MLVGNPVGRRHDAVIRSVQLQQAVAGAALDDVRLQAHSDDGDYFIEIEAKSSIRFRPSDTDFSETIRRARVAINSRGLGNHDQFVLAVPQTTTDLDVVMTLQRNATFKSPAEFRALLLNATSRTQLRIANNFCQTLGVGGTAVGYEDLWHFLQRFSVRPFDFDYDASLTRDTAELSIANAFGKDSATASAIFNELTRIVEAAATVAGVLSPEELFARLRKRFGDLRDPSGLRDVSDRIGQFSRLAASDIDGTICGLHLERQALSNELCTAVDRADIVLLQGASGRGKSALLQAYYSEVVNGGPVLLLSARRITLSNGWLAFANHLGINPDFGALARSLEGNAKGPVVLLDGLSEIDTPESQAVVNDLLLGLETELAGRKALKIVATTREQGLPSWLKVSGIKAPVIVSVPEATDEELDEIAEQFPAVRLLLARTNNPVLRTLFVLRVVLDQRTAPDLSTADALSEVDVVHAWWNKIVGAGRNGPAKQRALQLIAKELLPSSTRTFLGDAVEPESLAALQSEQIVIKDLRRDVYFLSHDLIQDWALMRLLGRRHDSLLATLDHIGDPPYLRRAVSLVAQAAFENPRTRPWFYRTRRLLSTEWSRPHWRSAFDSAIIASTKALGILRSDRDQLLEADASLLRGLLQTLTSVEVEPNVALAHAIAGDDSAATWEGVEFWDPLPRYASWLPILITALELVENIPSAANDDLFRAFAMWQRHTIGDMPLRLRIARQVVTFLKDAAIYRSSSNDTLIRHLCDIVSHSGDVAPSLISDFLAGLADSKRRTLATELITRPGRLPNDLPSAYSEFAALALIRKPGAVPAHYAPHEEISLDLGLRGNTTLYPPSPVQGPFLALLRSSESDGVRLINALVNLATRNYLRQSHHRGSRPVPTQLRYGRKLVALWGDEQVYQWFRPPAAAPAIATSALMALELYGEQQLESGRDAESLFDAILVDAESVAVAGVLVSLTLAYPATCLKAALPLVSAPTIWRMDVPRLVIDQTAGLSDIVYSRSRHEHLGKINDARNARPQRKLQVANLAALYLFSDDASVAITFEKLKDAPIDGARLWEREPVEVSAETVEVVRMFADRTNYKVVRADGQDYLHFERPPLTEVAKRQLDVGNAVQEAIALEMWGATTALRRTAANHFTAETADASIAKLRNMLQDELLSKDETFSYYAKRAIVDASAGILASAVSNEPVSKDVLARALIVVRQAATHFSAAGWYKNRDDADVLDERRVVAAGVSFARTLSLQSDDLDALIVSALSSGLLHVGEAVIRGTAALWLSDFAYASNVLRAYITTAQQSDGHAATTLSEFRERVAKRRTDLPDIAAGRGGRAYYALGLALQHIPIEDFAPNSAPIDLFADVARKYIAKAAGNPQLVERDHLTEWFQMFCGLVVTLSFKLAEPAGLDMLMQVAEGYSSWPQLLERILYSFVLQRLAFMELDDRSISQWKAISTYLIAELAKDASEWTDLRHKYRDIIWLLLFVSTWSGAMIRSDWPNASKFSDVIDRWVEAFKGLPTAMAALIAFLDKFHTQIPLGDSLSWLLVMWRHRRNSDSFWRESGNVEATALVLKSILESTAGDVNRVPGVSDLVVLLTELQDRGSATAAAIRGQLETRQDG